jgi:hypothetical protein
VSERHFKAVFAADKGGMVSEFAEGGVTMGNGEVVMALVTGLAVVLFVPTLVWASVSAGLYQIIQERFAKATLPGVEQLREAQQPMHFSQTGDRQD